MFTGTLENLLAWLRKVWLVVFFLSAVVIISQYLLQTDEFSNNLLAVDLLMLSIAIIFYVTYFITTVMIWRWLLYVIADIKVTVFDSMLQIVLVNLGKYIPGKIWGMVARGGLLIQRQINSLYVVQASFLEQVYLIYSAVVVSLGCVVVVIDSPLRWLLLPILFLMLITPYIWIRIFAKIGLIFFRKKTPWIGQIEKISPTVLVHLVIRYVTVWVMLGLSFAFIVRSISNIELNNVAIAWLLAANTVAYVAGFIAIFAPGGIGVRESIAAGILVNIMPLDQALISVLTFRLFIIVMELSAALIISPQLADIAKNYKGTRPNGFS